MLFFSLVSQLTSFGMNIFTRNHVILSLDPNIALIDLVFAVSATSRNSLVTYHLMRNTIFQFIEKYGAVNIHYSIIVYGDQLFRFVNFNHTFPPSAQELKMAIFSQPPLAAGPVLENVLEETLRIFNETESRPKAKKVLVVVTDKNSPVIDVDKLSGAVTPLENNGILVISVAIGAVNRSELLVISPNPLDVISVDSNIDAGVLAQRIMERILRRKSFFVCCFVLLILTKFLWEILQKKKRTPL